MTLEPPLHHEIVAFWREAGETRWWKKNPRFDAEIRGLFETAHLAAAAGDYADWEDAPESALALVLLTDQVPRNLYRGTAHAFATDPMARAVAERAIDRGFDARIDVDLRVFLYMPLEHAEDAAAQARCVALVEALPEAQQALYLRYARMHAEIIARFGRFPHRNAVLGRVTTPAEAAFLASGGFKG